MEKNYTTQLAGQIGESLVVAELGRRGIVATAFAGNVPEIDLVAYKKG
jgi:Holliday junction resolvase-like predicted endonuclease